MRTLIISQPWATLVARSVVRFVARDFAHEYRGTVVIQASPDVDQDALDRIQEEPEFAALLATHALTSAADINALPRHAIVGVAVITDLWNLQSLEEVISEPEAILLGDVNELATFWEFAENVEVDAIVLESYVAPEAGFDAAEDEHVDEDSLDDDVDVNAEPETPADLEPINEALKPRVREAVLAAGARFDDDDQVFWPLPPSPSLAALIGDDALGDRDITQRVWTYVAENDLQDPEDHTYVFLDDPLREALETDADGMTTIEFTDLIIAHIVRPSAA